MGIYKIKLGIITFHRSMNYGAVLQAYALQEVLERLGTEPTIIDYVGNYNYERFWQSDSDAVNSMDPYEAILWFTSRGHTCLSHRTCLSRFFVRTGALVFEIRK